MNLTVFIYQDYFSPEERTSSISAFMMGLMGVSEEALPFLVKHPSFILTNTISSALAGGIVATQGIHFYGGIGSPLGTIVGFMKRSESIEISHLLVPQLV